MRAPRLDKRLAGELSSCHDIAPSVQPGSHLRILTFSFEMVFCQAKAWPEVGAAIASNGSAHAASE
jgi:hypothetical protein